MTEQPASFNTQSARRTVGAGATITSVAAIATAVLGGVLGILVARVLGPADTGAYNVAASSFLILISVATLGINIGATYRASHGEWAAGDAFRQLVVAGAAIGTVGACLVVVLAALTADSLFAGVPVELIAVAAGAAVPALVWTFVASLALALDRYEVNAFAPLSTNVVALAAAAILAPTYGLTGAVIALAAGQAAAAAWLLRWGLVRLPAPVPGWFARTARELRATVAFGIQSYLPIVFQFVAYRADLFVLNAVAAQAVVGHYAVALVVTEVGLLIPRSLAAVILPRVAALDRAGTAGERDFVIVKSVRHAVLLAPAMCAMLTVGVLLIPLVFGSDFSDAVGPGLVLVPGVALLGAAGILSSNAVAAGRPDLVLRASLVVFPVTIALYAVLVPAFEIWGAAVGSTIAYTLASLAYLIAFRRAVPDAARSGMLPSSEELRDYRELWARARRRRRG
jgi:O-antigen/teichoic acid export membrane protein